MMLGPSRVRSIPAVVGAVVAATVLTGSAPAAVRSDSRSGLTNRVTIRILNSLGNPLTHAALNIGVLERTGESDYHGTTNTKGEVSISLPDGGQSINVDAVLRLSGGRRSGLATAPSSIGVRLPSRAPRVITFRTPIQGLKPGSLGCAPKNCYNEFSDYYGGALLLSLVTPPPTMAQDWKVLFAFAPIGSRADGTPGKKFTAVLSASDIGTTYDASALGVVNIPLGSYHVAGGILDPHTGTLYPMVLETQTYPAHIVNTVDLLATTAVTKLDFTLAQ
jgi:hypothetical protein